MAAADGLHRFSVPDMLVFEHPERGSDFDLLRFRGIRRSVREDFFRPLPTCAFLDVGIGLIQFGLVGGSGPIGILCDTGQVVAIPMQGGHPLVVNASYAKFADSINEFLSKCPIYVLVAAGNSEPSDKAHCLALAAKEMRAVLSSIDEGARHPDSFWGAACAGIAAGHWLARDPGSACSIWVEPASG